MLKNLDTFKEGKAIKETLNQAVELRQLVLGQWPYDKQGVLNPGNTSRKACLPSGREPQ